MEYSRGTTLVRSGMMPGALSSRFGGPTVPSTARGWSGVRGTAQKGFSTDGVRTTLSARVCTAFPGAVSLAVLSGYSSSSMPW